MTSDPSHDRGRLARAVASAVVAVVVATAGMLGGAAAARAEMTDPPMQANVDWIPEPQLSFNVVGGVPASLQGSWQLDRIDDSGFAYAPVAPSGWVTPGPVERFNEYKGGGCSASGFVIRCQN
ncbi:hypothetical protein [Herbiconiux flava]|uniref:Uncharacterized protein n=1 Tax=Herbiconiux flava TaxID=881268 RepID=A0A852SSU0_9MICO|nr:hypothetical protein [Herbiconiux flava]NYD71959.1 hypothetical protein [Herbiconiux flava]GLK18078.1 hypothetical protein GCM10017602_25600 [Herbiconiux flava]